LNIGFFKVHEYQEILFSEQFTLIEKESIKSMNDFIPNFDFFDFDNETFGDLKDYIEFREYNKVVFVANCRGNRLDRIIQYMSSYVDCEISIEKKCKYKKISNTDIKKRYSYSYKSLLTGAYPEKLKDGYIKHIYCVDETDVNKLNRTIIDFCFCNSVLIVQKEIKEINIPLIIKTYDSYALSQSESLFDFDRTMLKESLTNFVDTGKIDFKSGIIKDYYVLLNLFKLNRLVIGNDEIFIDLKRTVTLGTITDSYLSIQNKFTTYYKNVKSDYSKKIIEVFSIACEINSIYQSDFQFISPYNRYKQAPVLKEVTNNYTSWVGFLDLKTSKYFLYNIFEKRLFDIDENFVEIFEVLVKELNKECNIDKNLLSEAARLLENV